MKDPEAHEGAGLWGGRLLRFEALPSTNSWALNNASDCRHGDVIHAIRQTDGRGRFDREWLSPEDLGLTCTVVVHRGTPEHRLKGMLLPATALAVRATLSAMGIKAGVKWPNDVVVGTHKICGILAEQAAVHALVLGIGLNVNTTEDDLPASELMQGATSILAQTGVRQDVNAVLTALLDHLADDISSACRDPGSISSIWNEHDIMLHRKINVSTPTRILEGTHKGMNTDGSLLFRDSAGTDTDLRTGDVSLQIHSPAT